MSGQPSSAALALAGRLRTIVEPGQRALAATQYLDAEPSEAVVDALGELIAGAEDSLSPHWLALDSVLLALSKNDLLGYERRADLYRAAVDCGHQDVAMLLLESAPIPPEAERLEKKSATDMRLIPTGRPLTLGERKSLARTQDRQLLSQVVRDSHPSVIEILMENPHLVEADVLRLATRRPNLPDSLVVISLNHRWRVRPQVRRALVLNPYTPMPIAARLITTLPSGELRRVAKDPALKGALRQQARLVLARRRSWPLS